MASESEYRRFWSLVWPHLEAGAWRYDLQPGPQAEETSADHLDGGTTAVAAGLDAYLNGCDGGIVNASDVNSSSGIKSHDSGSSADITEKNDRGVGGGRASRSSSSSRKRRDSSPLPVFFPPAVGVASKGLERALHRDSPTDAKAGNRIERLEGIVAVVGLLQRVPGYPVMTSAGSVPSMDAVAAAARAVLVPAAARHEQLSPGMDGASTPGGSSPGGSDVGDGNTKRPVSCSYPPSASSVNGDSPGARRSAGGRIVRRCSPTANTSQRQALPGVSDADGKKTPDDADAAMTTSRIGRAIKKPVRLEDQVAMQMLSPRNGRDGPWRAAAREAAARVAALAAGASASTSVATTSVANRGIPTQSNGILPSSSSEAKVDREKKSGAERCIARLGTSFGGGGTVTSSSTSPSTVRGWHGPSWGNGSSSSCNSELGKRSRSDGHVNGTNASSAGINSSGGGVGNGLNGSTELTEKRNVRRALPGGACSGNAAVEVAAHSAACEAPAACSAGAVRCDESNRGGGGGGGTSLKKSGWGGQMIVPHPPPPRPVGMGKYPEETIKEYRRSFDDVIWPGLEEEHGWNKVYGPRNSDTYYLPRGIERGKNGAKCRLDFFDSFKQVIEHMIDNGAIFDDLLERAWAKSITKPRAISKKSGKARRKKTWTGMSKRKTPKSNMMTPEHPRKVSAVGKNHQVDPMNLCPAVPSKDYTAPEDVIFEQVWDPKVMSPPMGMGWSCRDPDELVQEFSGAVSHDKCLEILYRCEGNHFKARLKLLDILRFWNAQHPGAMNGRKHLSAARSTVGVTSAVRMAEWAKVTGTAGKSAADRPEGLAGDSEPEYLTKVTHWSGASKMVSSRRGYVAGDGTTSGGDGSGSSRRVIKRRVWTTTDEKEFWRRPLSGMFGGELALKRQLEGAISTAAPAARRDGVSPDLDLSHPWSKSEAETYTKAMVEDGSKDFHAVQKALPDRQVCELVDRYYAGWKETEGYKQLKEKLQRSKRQAACWVCGSGGDLICCDGCEGVYHVECANLPQVPEGDWFCTTCAESNAAGEPRSSSCSSSSVTSSNANGARSGAISGSDGRSRVVESFENGIGGSSTGTVTRAPLSTTTGSDGKACGSSPSKRHRADDGSCGESSRTDTGSAVGLDKAASFDQSETATKATKKRKIKISAPSRKVASGAMFKVVEPRGLERVPIRLGTAHNATGTANGSLRVSDSSTAPSMTQVSSTSGPGPAASEVAGVQAEELSSTSMVETCQSNNSDEPNHPVEVARNGASPVMAGGEAIERVQPANGLCPSVDAATPVQDRARARALASAASSRVPAAATSRLLARASDPEPEPDSVTHEQLDGGTAVEVDVGSMLEAGMSIENTEASWQCRCCNRRNCGKDARCRECGASRPMGGGARAARRDGKRSRVTTTLQPPSLRTSERLKTAIPPAPAPAPAAEAAASRKKKVSEGSAPMLTPWSCRACATYNKNRWTCSTCGTRHERKTVEEGKPEWWCCRSCSRFNSRSQDGNRCRFCRFEAPSVEEDEEEVISVGEEGRLSPVMSNGVSERIALRLPPA